MRSVEIRGSTAVATFVCVVSATSWPRWPTSEVLCERTETYVVRHGAVGCSGYGQSKDFNNFVDAYDFARGIINSSYYDDWIIELDPPSNVRAWENEVEWLYVYKTV